jgi:hypothetical protein
MGSGISIPDPETLLFILQTKRHSPSQKPLFASNLYSATV